MWFAYGTFRASAFSSVLHIGQTELVIEDEDDGDAEEDRCDEWHDGVLSADKPADSAIWSSGTAGIERRLL